MKKLMCLLLAAVMCLSLGACGKKLSEGSIKEGFCYEQTGISPDATVMLVEGTEIPMDMYLNCLFTTSMSIEQIMTQYGMSIDWDFEFSDGMTMRELVVSDAMANAQRYAKIENLAAANNIVLSEEDIEKISQEREDMIEDYGGEEKYKEELEKASLSEDTYLRICRIKYLYDALEAFYMTEGSDLYVTDETLEKYAAENGYITADHILVEGLTDESKEKAGELLEKLRDYAGDDLTAYFTELADEHSTDPGRATNPDGYTFKDGEMVEAFESAAKALGEGEFSELVETSYGYHIILRKPLDVSSITENLRAQYFSDVVCAVDEKKITMNKALEQIDPQPLYEAFMDIQNGVSGVPDIS